jgi:hypothetical protein
MVYDRTKRNYGDEQWHCPFSREWVERMKRAASHCRELTANQIETCLESEWSASSYIELTADRLESEWFYYELPPAEFLSEAQDVRGLPLSWCDRERRRFSNIPDGCTAVYDYDSVPEVVLTDGHNDWVYVGRGVVLTA